MSEVRLNHKNLKLILGVLIFDAALIWLAMTGQSAFNIQLPKTIVEGLAALVRPGILLSVFMVLLIIVRRMIPNKIKEILVFWRIHNRLPGCRAFSIYIYDEPKIDIVNLKKKIGKFPEDPYEQNLLWFKLFKKHESKPEIQQENQTYLFLRDMATITVQILIVGFLICPIAGRINNYTFIMIGLIMQCLVLMYAARNSAIHLVINVLARESSS